MTSIKIIGCGDSLMWYKNHIGKIFFCFNVDSDGFWVRDAQGYKNIILHPDARLVKTYCNLTDRPMALSH